MTPARDFTAIDVSSLYPSIMLDYAFPIGRPFEAKENELDRYFLVNEKGSFFNGVKVTGCLQVQILAPRDLAHPLLPIPVNDAHVFGICRKCCELKLQKKCSNHSDEARSFEITLTTHELQMATALGYKMLRLFHGLLYTEEDHIFADFVRVLAREKVRVSGIPSTHTASPEKYAFEVNCDLGLKGSLKLSPDDFVFNPMLRYLAKVSLVAVAGKFMQKADNQQRLISEYSDLVHFYKEKRLVNLDCISDDHCFVTLKRQKKKFYTNRQFLIGAMIIAIGRLKMYQHWQKLSLFGAKILYCDVDSFFLTMPKGLKLPFKLSQCPGYFKMDYEDQEIIAYVALGPKNYSILMKDKAGCISEKFCCCGLTLSQPEVKKILSFELYKQHLESFLCDYKKATKITQVRKRINMCSATGETSFTKNFTVFTMSCQQLKNRYIGFSSPFLDTFPYGICKEET